MPDSKTCANCGHATCRYPGDVDLGRKGYHCKDWCVKPPPLWARIKEYWRNYVQGE